MNSVVILYQLAPSDVFSYFALSVSDKSAARSIRDNISRSAYVIWTNLPRLLVFVS